MTVQGERQESERARNTWVSMAGGTATWALHLGVVYALTSLACERGWLERPILGLPGLQFVHLVTTLVAAVMVIGFGLLAWRVWQGDLPQESRLIEATEGERPRFMAMLAFLLNALYLLAIVISFVPILVVPACG
jgi:hypothetical protein